ncbi:ATP-dependent endonuclease, partial [Klebsiella pneumoniae]|nr:ATP-dependent endonuclease [Klebsiella pneumoniae]
EIIRCRQNGHVVYDRWSIPDFERFLGGTELGKDKPYSAFHRISSDDELKVKVQNLISSLFNGDDYDPIGHDPNGEFISQILAELNVWAIKNNQQHSIRIIGV